MNKLNNLAVLIQHSSKSILRDIVTCIESLHKNSSLTFQQIPSHTGLESNEIANKLAKVTAVPNADTDFDLFKSQQKRGLKEHCTQEVFFHHWYMANRPGVLIDSGLNHCETSCLSRL